MTAAKHTPGTVDPWTRHEGQYGDRRGIVIRNAAGIIAFIPQDAGRQFAAFDAERAKCADLMFAAPALLEALEQARKQIAALSKIDESGIGHDDAQSLVAHHVHEIQVLCDAFGYDPCEWLQEDVAKAAP